MEVLYRKYRPSNFKEVLGQDHIVKAISSSINLGNISHAYLFSGSRGTGKTSIARILAKELETSTNDLYEIDAANIKGATPKIVVTVVKMIGLNLSAEPSITASLFEIN